MNNKRNKFFIVASICIYAITILVSVLHLVFEYGQAPDRSNYRFTNLTKQISQCSKTYEIGSDIFTDKVLSAIGNVEDIEFIQISYDDALLISYPVNQKTTKARSNLVRLYQTSIATEDNRTIKVTASIYLLKPSVIFKTFRIAFFVILVVSLILVVYIIFFAEDNNDDDNDDNDDDDNDDNQNSDDKSEDTLEDDEDNDKVSDEDSEDTLESIEDTSDDQKIDNSSSSDQDVIQVESNDVAIAEDNSITEEEITFADDSVSDDTDAYTSSVTKEEKSFTDDLITDSNKPAEEDTSKENKVSDTKKTLDEKILEAEKSEEELNAKKLEEAERIASGIPADETSDEDKEISDIIDEFESVNSETSETTADSSVEETAETPVEEITFEELSSSEEINSEEKVTSEDKENLIVEETTDSQNDVTNIDLTSSDDKKNESVEENTTSKDLTISSNFITDSSSDKPQGLFDDKTGFGWESYMKQRLDSELVRAASSQTDLSLIYIKIQNVNLKDEQCKDLCKCLLNEAGFADLIFDYGEEGCSIIRQNCDTDQALVFAEKLYTSLIAILRNMESTSSNETLQKAKIGMGISARTYRIISANRFANEAEQALERSLMDNDSPIIAFRVDPAKYNQYLKRQ